MTTPLAQAYFEIQLIRDANNAIAENLPKHRSECMNRAMALDMALQILSKHTKGTNNEQ